MVRRSILIALVAALAAAGAEPRRIVSTSPAITEILYALGLGERVVGVTQYCHYPPEAMQKPKVGDFMRPNLEVIVGLRPDLVITETTGIRATVKLKMAVLEIDNASLAAIRGSILKIGSAAGVPDRAKALAAKMDADLAAIRARTAKLPRRRAMFVAGRTPGRLEDIVVPGRQSHLSELIEIAGGENIFKDGVAAYSKISMEELIARNPEVVIDMGEMAQTIGRKDSEKQAVVALWNTRLPNLAAVKRKGVFAVASDIYVVPALRVVDAAREFARMIHPEAGL